MSVKRQGLIIDIYLHYYRMSTSPEFGLATMYRLIKKSGAERVSDEAADELRKVLEDIAYRIAQQGVDLSVHAGRKTIKSDDIRLAAKNILKL
jgi:DNA-binding protein